MNKLIDLRSWYESETRSVYWIEKLSVCESNTLLDKLETCSLPFKTRQGIIDLIKFYKRQSIKIVA
jgi:hypothetical protein